MPTTTRTSTASRPTTFRSVSDRARTAGATARLVVNAHRRPRLQRAPLVSVVIATYNWSSVLAHAVRSALAQRYPSLEVIVVGDGCTDGSEAVVRAIGDPRVRWDNLERNSGSQSLPNNRGIELAGGDFIAYLGHDDLWHPDHLVHLVADIERAGVGLAASVMCSVGPPGSNAYRLVRWMAPSAVLHRRDVVEQVGGWRDFRTIELNPDMEFMARVVAGAGVVHGHALTVWKFPSAWRRNSYLERRDDEQARYARRMADERLFVERELGRWLWLRMRGAEERLPEEGARPEVVPPGWQVRQFRRIRGLPEEPDG